MNPLHLLWIIPVSMLVGAISMACMESTTCENCYYRDSSEIWGEDYI